MSTIIVITAKYLYLVIVLIGVITFFRLPKEKRFELFVFACVALPVMLALLVLASLYNNPRPFVVEHFTPLIPHAPDNGFPSDHTILSAAVAALIFPYARRVGIALFVLAVLVGGARVLAGVHHTIDIVGSIIIATLTAYIVYCFVLPHLMRALGRFKIPVL